MEYKWMQNNGVQPLSNSGGVRELPDSAMPANWWARKAYRGLLF